jgi:shikimate 5-dehydrogenase
VRDVRKSRAVAERFGANCENLAAAKFSGFDLVINTTPLGTTGALQNQTPATAKQLRGARLVYDLVYNPKDTRFLHEAREAGCKTLGGLPMLVSQALEQFRLWTGTPAPAEVMRVAAECQLSIQRSADI